MKYKYLWISVLFFVLAFGLSFVSFLGHCEVSSTSRESYCHLPTGHVAKIDSAARVSVFSDNSFTLTYNQPGNTPVQETIEPGGYGALASFDITTDGPIEIKMVKSTIMPPLVSIDPLNPQDTPTLIVSKTWYKPFVELFQLPTVFLFIILFVIGTIFFGDFLTSKK